MSLNSCWRISLFSATFLVFLGLTANAYNIEGGGVCNCSSCLDCTNALSDNGNCYSTVKLTADVVNAAGTCINNPQNFMNKTFDCQTHTLLCWFKFNNKLKYCLLV